MQMRIRLWLERKNRKIGTLVCARCGMPHQFALWEGGLCRRCHNATAKPPRRQAPKPNCSDRTPLPETLALRTECQEAMRRADLPAYRMARMLGIPSSTFFFWFNGNLGPNGQRNINAKIREGLDRLRQPQTP